jgi:hypothetical protein
MSSTQWLSPLGSVDDFGVPYDGVMIDGKTQMGPWANMTLESWEKYGIGKLGLGYGQRYHQDPDGKWIKVQG